jgi:hypothetical protein
MTSTMTSSAAVHRIHPQLAHLARPIASLKLDPENARVHSPRSIEAIAQSLRRFGQPKPVKIDADGVVRAGNGTVLAAQRLGWTHVAASRARNTGDRLTAYAIADNRTAELSTWDDRALLADLQQMLEAVEGAEGDAINPGLEGAALVLDLGFTQEDLHALADRVSAGEHVDETALGMTLVFDHERQAAQWDGFLRALAHAFPEIPSPSGRVLAHVRALEASGAFDVDESDDSDALPDDSHLSEDA